MLRTVLGELSPSDVRGAVLPHEHLVMDYGTGDPAASLTRTDLVVDELRRLRASHDLGLVVDLTCVGLGPDPTRLRQVAEASGVSVVAATGFYWQRYHPRWVTEAGLDDLTAFLVDEVERGLSGSDVRPGVFGEVGSHGDEPAPAEARCLRATARAAVHTGLSVSTHADLGHGGQRQLELLCDEGLPPERVCIGHQDLIDEPQVHRDLARAGAYVAFDTIGKAAYQPDSTRLRLVLNMIEAGHADRVLLSNDVSRDGYLSRETGGYGHLFTSFLPALAAAGVDAATIRMMVRDNPLRFLCGADGTGDGGTSA
jgi:phosphotriesterase-related protein